MKSVDHHTSLALPSYNGRNIPQYGIKIVEFETEDEAA
jgi:hypothetical protein